MYSYECIFNFWGTTNIVGYDQAGIHAFSNGFWITSELKFTKGCDCKYWIPPSQILYIEKIGKENID